MINFNIFKKLFWLSVMIIAVFTMCQDKDDDNGFIIDETYRPVKVDPISGLRIGWDHSSLSQLSETGSNPRMIRLDDASLVAVYEENNNIYMRRSEDEGLSWNSPEVLFPKTTHEGKDGDYKITINNLMSQPTIIQLENGDLLAACAVTYSYLISKDVIEYPAAIRVRRITGGTYMRPVEEVYSNLGCESPSLLELPNNTIQLYFTNGPGAISIEMMSSTALLTTVSERKIDMISSVDGGITWSSHIKEFGPDGKDELWTGAKTIATRAKKNNKTPSASVVGDDIVVALSDDKTVTFKPFTVRTSIDNNWSYAINGDTKDRHYAFYEIVPDEYYMSSPDLLVLSSGETLLGYETDGNRFDDSETMEVAIGDNKAMNFHKFSRPFPFPDRNNAINNSLMQLDDKTIVAMTTSNFEKKDQTAPWYMKGHLINDLSITESEITEHPIFVGSKSDANISVGLGYDVTNLYVHVKAMDDTQVSAEAGSQKGDGVYLYIDAANLSLLDVDAGISKLWISSTGDVMRWNGKEGAWVSGSADGITVTPTVETDGYSLDIVIPTAKLTNFNKGGIRFAAGLNNYINEEQGTTELLSLCKDLRSSSWLGVTF